MNVDFNYIGSVDFGSNSDNYLPCLERFEISKCCSISDDNLLTNFDIEVPLPRLQYLLLNNNKTLDSLIVSGQPSLIRLDASNMRSLRRLLLPQQVLDRGRISLPLVAVSDGQQPQ